VPHRDVVRRACHPQGAGVAISVAKAGRLRVAPESVARGRRGREKKKSKLVKFALSTGGRNIQAEIHLARKKKTGRKGWRE